MEKRDLYDKNRNLVGKTIYKGDDIPDNYYILVVIIFMQNKDGRFLIQKRSLDKGGKWATTGGHPKSGETSLEGLITEVKEEIGLDISKENVKLVDSKTDKKMICDLYYVNMDINLNKIVCQKEEVSEVKFATIDEIKEMINSDEFHKNHGKAFLHVLDLLNI